jgi:hypothetical protein
VELGERVSVGCAGHGRVHNQVWLVPCSWNTSAFKSMSPEGCRRIFLSAPWRAAVVCCQIPENSVLPSCIVVGRQLALAGVPEDKIEDAIIRLDEELRIRTSVGFAARDTSPSSCATARCRPLRPRVPGVHRAHADPLRRSPAAVPARASRPRDGRLAAAGRLILTRATAHETLLWGTQSRGEPRGQGGHVQLGVGGRLRRGRE